MNTLENLLSEENITLPEDSSRQDKVKALLKVYLKDRLPTKETERFLVQNPETQAAKMILSSLINVTTVSLDTDEDAVKVLKELKQIKPKVSSTYTLNSSGTTIYVEVTRPISFTRTYRVTAEEYGNVAVDRDEFLTWVMAEHPEYVELDAEAIKEHLIEEGIVDENNANVDEPELLRMLETYSPRPVYAFIVSLSDANTLMTRFLLEDCYDIELDDLVNEDEETSPWSTDDYEYEYSELGVDTTDREIHEKLGL